MYLYILSPSQERGDSALRSSKKRQPPPRVSLPVPTSYRDTDILDSDATNPGGEERALRGKEGLAGVIDNQTHPGINTKL
ncbi:hypothetical protein EYF80_056341 [Liparis tanakae]|uniref:Uncharacterized protein n=1 Tax=Liparis tanakae TaxID=230148 RepID=A0A4Z2EXA6_9TELE|nr:hypothetical protein EYF80_056341 [Liparis tanakae]